MKHIDYNLIAPDGVEYPEGQFSLEVSATVPHQGSYYAWCGDYAIIDRHLLDTISERSLENHVEVLKRGELIGTY